MSFKFKPRLESMEAREVPVALSFQLLNGAVGSGLFSTPAGVDPAQGWQSLAITDLTVTYAGQV